MSRVSCISAYNLCMQCYCKYFPVSSTLHSLSLGASAFHTKAWRHVPGCQSFCPSLCLSRVRLSPVATKTLWENSAHRRFEFWLVNETSIVVMATIKPPPHNVIDWQTDTGIHSHRHAENSGTHTDNRRRFMHIAGWNLTQASWLCHGPDIFGLRF